jgi:hypothetical protein
LDPFLKVCSYFFKTSDAVIEIVIVIEAKQKYLDENYPLGDAPRLTDRKECLHCGKIITVADFKVFRDDTGFEYISCPNAPDCDGTAIDWLPLGNE